MDLFSEQLLDVLGGTRSSVPSLTESLQTDNSVETLLPSPYNLKFEPIEILGSQHVDVMESAVPLSPVSNPQMSTTEGFMLPSQAVKMVEMEATQSSSEGTGSWPAALEARSPPTPSTELFPIPKPKQYKHWKDAKPSKFCHGCGRSPRGQWIVCKNIKAGTCRKMFCAGCLEKVFGSFDMDAAMRSSWACLHCTGACPTRASCRYYSRTNAKRYRGNKK